MTDSVAVFWPNFKTLEIDGALGHVEANGEVILVSENEENGLTLGFISTVNDYGGSPGNIYLDQYAARLRLTMGLAYALKKNVSEAARLTKALTTHTFLLRKDAK